MHVYVIYLYTKHNIMYYVHAYFMHLLLLITCQGQEGTSLLIVGLNAAGDVWREPIRVPFLSTAGAGTAQGDLQHGKESSWH